MYPAFVQFAKFLVALAAVIVAVAVQMNVIPLLPLGLNRVDILVVAVTYGALVRGAPVTLPWAVGAGLLADLYSSGGFGVHVLTLLTVIGVVSISARHLVTNYTLPAWLTLCALGAVIGSLTPQVIEWLMQAFHFTPWRWTGLATRDAILSIGVSLAVQLAVLTILFVSRRRIGEWVVRR
ncbi:MAG: hypothetical protein PHI63_00395 [Patescibacteria group bacterium]|nr:hypothetical protein [Patescibacteria group bacterium]